MIRVATTPTSFCSIRNAVHCDLKIFLIGYDLSAFTYLLNQDILILLLTKPLRKVTIINLRANYLFSKIGDMGGHGGKAILRERKSICVIRK